MLVRRRAMDQAFLRKHLADRHPSLIPEQEKAAPR